MIRIRSARENERVFQQIRNIPASFEKGIFNANTIIGNIISKEAKRSIREDPKSGRTYILRDIYTAQLVRHKASAPGQSPALFSGSLATSISYIASGNQLVIGAGTGGSDVQFVRIASLALRREMPGQMVFGRIVNYARRLELEMNRPYLISSIEKKQRDAENYYYLEISNALKNL